MKERYPKILAPLAFTLVLGATACEGDSQADQATQEIDHSAEIERLVIVRDAAQTSLDGHQAALTDYLGTLSKDCHEAIRSFIPPDGFHEGTSQYETPTDEAMKITVPWCGPSNIDAVEVVRDLHRDIASLETATNQASYGISAHLSKLGIQPEDSER